MVGLVAVAVKTAWFNVIFGVSKVVVDAVKGGFVIVSEAFVAQVTLLTLEHLLKELIVLICDIIRRVASLVRVLLSVTPHLIFPIVFG
jgi:hypothetical protein